MAFEVRVVTGALTDVSGAFTDFEYPGFGTPQACIVILSNAAVGFDPSNTALMSYGVYDGTDQYCASWSVRDGTATNNGAGRFGNKGRVAVVKAKLTSTTYTTYAEYTASWVPGGNGVRLTLSVDGTSASRYCTVILIKGATAVKAGAVEYDGATSPYNYEGVGFQADVLAWMICGVSDGFVTSIENNIVSGSVGFAHNHSVNGVQQVCYSTNVSTSATSHVNTVLRDDCIENRFYTDGNVINNRSSLSAFDSLGFTITNVVGGGFGLHEAAYLAIKLPNQDDAWLDVIEIPASTTGNVSYTQPGWRPQAILSIAGNILTLNDPDGLAYGGVTYGAAANAASGFTQRSHIATVEDAQSSQTSVSSRYSDTLFETRNATDDGQRPTATVSSFDTNGFTLNYTAPIGTARYVALLAFKEGAGVTAPTVAALTPTTGNRPRFSLTF